MELIEQVINRQNMMRAFKQVRQNRGSAGVGYSGDIDPSFR